VSGQRQYHITVSETQRSVFSTTHKLLSLKEQIRLLESAWPTNAQVQAEKAHIEAQLVVNLSSYQLAEPVQRVLNRGFSFVPSATRIRPQARQTMEGQVEKFIRGLTIRLNREIVQTETERGTIAVAGTVQTRKVTTAAAQVRTPSLVEALARVKLLVGVQQPVSYQVKDKSNELALNNLKQKLKAEVQKAERMDRENLNPEERRELEKLMRVCQSGEIVLRKADKSQQIVLMNRVDYEAAVTIMLADTESYRPVPFNLKYYTAAKIRAIVRRYQPALLTTETANILLEGTKQPKSRKFYGLPKTHKEKGKWKCNIPPLRPICPDQGTETTCTGKLIAYYLSPIMMNLPSYLKNSYELVKLLATIKDLPTDAVLLVADVENLYPSIPIRQGHERIAKVLMELKQGTQAERQFILSLLEVQLENNCFEFNNQFYKQVKGVPMGKAWAPAVASIYLAEWEAQVFQQTNIVPLLYKRYIDDILCILPTRQSAETLLHCMRNLDSNIRISEYTVGSAVHFLDVNMKIEHRQIVTTLYKKPTHLQVLLHYQSAHSTSLKLNIVLSQLIRVYRLSTDLIQAGWEMRMFVKLMTEIRGLPQRKARWVWRRFKKWLYRENQTEQCKTSPTRPVTLWLTNNTISKAFCNTLNPFLEELHPRERRKLQRSNGVEEVECTRNSLLKSSVIRVQHLTEKCVGLRAFKA
jgi:hypothetical protein